ncbi:MAG: CPBP family intramembrane glutamic endopeptidase [Vicinamibacterales bacterium]
MIWLLLSAGPFLFLTAIIAASLIASLAGTPSASIPQRVTGWMPHLLLVVQVGLLLVLVLTTSMWRPVVSVGLLWQQSVATALLAGALSGGTLAFVYLRWIGRGLAYLQRHVGDYVPPGELLPTLSNSVGLFFVANVLLAPVVEEVLYRGYAIPTLTGQVGLAGAMVISCIFFGVLHWPGGLWYMIATGVIAGGMFATLYVWQGTVLAPLTAHFVLNVVEFAVAWRNREG